MTTAQGAIGKRGLTTLVRTYLNVPLQTSTTNITLLSRDASFTYDACGRPMPKARPRSSSTTR